MSTHSTDRTGLEIAVTGMSIKVPGAANTRQFWNNLAGGVESVRFFTEEELTTSGIPAATFRDKNYVKAKGIFDNLEAFDAAFFGFTPKEAERIDPQMRLFFQCVYEALEDAGCDPAAARELIGVYVGAAPSIAWQHTTLLACKQQYSEEFNTLLLNDKDFLSTRISYLFNLKGPSCTLYTACSTSLVTVDAACQGLLTGKCDTAIAGAVSVSLPQKAGYLYEPGMIMSRDGHTRSYDESAGGSIFSDGMGVVVLKRLEDALAEGCPIHAVIKGTAVNNDGSRKIGYTAPSVEGQAAVIAAAHQMAEVAPETISYVEGHGSATPIGDKIEIEALNLAFGRTAPGFHCPIGSVKANLGHLNTAAGMAGLIKTILMMQHRLIPPNLNFTRPNARLAAPGGRFYVNTTLTPWRAGAGPVRAGISSFGIGGTNVHLILEEAPAAQPSSPAREPQLLVLSAKTGSALERMAGNLGNFLAERPETNLADLAYTLQAGRAGYAHRRMLTVANHQEAVRKLLDPGPRSVQTHALTGPPGPLVFMFPGVGGQYPAMGGQLYAQEPAFRKEADRCFEILYRLTGEDLTGVLYPGADAAAARERINQFQTCQLVVFVFEYALARLLGHWGLRANYLIGYSLGEYVAACLAGVFTLEEALHLLVVRKRLIEKLPASTMLSVPLGAGELLPMLPAGVHLAIDNGASCVVAGEVAGISAFEQSLKTMRLLGVRLSASHALHTPVMAPILAEYEAHLRNVPLREPGIPFISNVTGDWIRPGEATSPQYWLRHLSEPVRFAAGLARLLETAGAAYVEVGPGNDICALLGRLLPPGHEPYAAGLIPNAGRAGADLAFLLGRVGQLWLRGYAVHWRHLHGAGKRSLLSLPAYPFEETTYPVRLARVPGPDDLPRDSFIRKQADVARWFYLPSWKKMNHITGSTTRSLPEAFLLFRNPGPAGNALAGTLSGNPARQVISVTPGQALQRISDTEFVINPGRPEDYEYLFWFLKSQGTLCAQLVHAWNVTNADAPAASPAGEDVEAALQRGYYSLVNCMKALGKLNLLPHDFRICVIADRLYDVTGAETVDAAKSALVGALKVIPQEYPNVKCQLIDLDPAADPAGCGDAIRNELVAADAGTVVAYRGATRWLQTFEPVRLPAPPAAVARLVAQGTYLITGGLGNIGTAIAEFLAGEYQANLVLVARTPLPGPAAWDAFLENAPPGDDVARKIRSVRRLEALGGRVLMLAADVADPVRMHEVVALAEQTFGPVRGVIHTAGAVHVDAFSPIGAQQPSHCATHFTPKVQGTLVLRDVLRDKNPDFVLLTSSLSSVLGGIGLSAYAAANHFQDTLCRSQRAAGKPWISLNWADWAGWEKDVKDIAISAEALQLNISADEGIETLRRVLHGAGHEPQVVISSGDLAQRLNKWVYRTEDGEEGRPSVPAAAAQHKPGVSNDYAAPEGEAEAGLVTLWEELLGFQGIGATDDFMELGGDSLKSIIMLSRVHKSSQVTIPLEDFFRNRTIRAIAGMMQRAETSAYVPIAPAAPQDRYPLSSAQKRLYFLREFDPSGVSYNETHVDILEGKLDLERVREAFRGLIRRHESFRTTIGLADDEPVQQVHPAVPFDIELMEGAEDQLPAILRQFVRPFAFDQAPFLRVGVVRLAADRHALLLDRHHIISDGISSEILVREFVALYMEAALPPLKLQYRDYAVWQQQERNSPRVARQVEYWQRVFAGAIPVLELPTDFARPAVQSFEGATIRFQLGREEAAGVRELARRHDTTLHAVLLAAFNVLLARLSRQEDVVVGTPVAGRNHPDLENIIGIFVNTLPLRNFPASDKPFDTFLQEVKERSLEAFGNQECPYEDILEQLAVVKDVSRNPLFDVMYVHHRLRVLDLPIPGLERHAYHHSAGKAKFDLNLICWEHPSELTFTLEYNTALFSGATAQRFAGYFTNILAAVGENPAHRIGAIPMLAPAEREQLLHGFNRFASRRCEGKVLQQLFEERAAQSGADTALVSGSGSLTYAELNRRSNQLAQRLRNQGVGPDCLVGLLTGRSAEMIVGLLATLKAGGAYLPLDATLPPERIGYMLRDGNPRLLITDHTTQGLAAGLATVIPVLNVSGEEYYAGSGENLPLVNKETDLVYALYTSGSTGKPKGVLLEHRNAVNLVHHCLDHTPLEYRKVLQFSTIAFDVSFSEIFYTLCAGGTLYLIDEATRKDIPGLLGFIGQHQISTIFLPMSLLRVLFSEKEYVRAIPACIKHIQTAGEQVVVTGAFREYLQRNQVWLHNHYGPAETHVVTTLALPPGPDVPSLPSIGFPIVNTQVYLLNPAHEPVPVGVPGELCVGGAQVGRGYLGREALTALKFVPDPYAPGGVLYKTGDLARWRPDGSIEFLGRLDQQVKIRGYRVEPGEVEQALLNVEGVQEAVVQAVAGEGGEKYLCAYLVAPAKVDVAAVRAGLARHLPEYMLPAYFVQIERMPLTANEKINRAALPPPVREKTQQFVSPHSPEEKGIAALWAGLLRLPPEDVGAADNFFERGGHSLKAMQLTAKIEREYGVKIPLTAFFAAPTVGGLARYVGRHAPGSGQARPGATIPAAPPRPYYAATSVQQRLYFLHRMNPGGLEYNMPAVHQIEGALDVARLDRAMHQLVRRHEALRTAFAIIDNEIVQKIDPEAGFRMDVLPAPGAGGPDPVIDGFIRPFRLDQAPLFRVGLLAVAPDRYLLLTDFHHIIFDGVSIGIFIRELIELYNGNTLPPSALQFRDFACWQTGDGYRQHLHPQEKYWQERFLPGLPAPLRLPTDYPRPAARSFAGAALGAAFGPEEAAQIHRFARAQEVTLFVFLLGVYNVLLHKLTSQADIVVGTPVAGRRSAQLENLIGMFINTVPLRNFPESSKTFSAFLAEVKENTLRDLDNQEYSFENLAGRMQPGGQTGRNPLFDVMLELDNTDSVELRIPGLAVTPRSLAPKAAKFDLTLSVRETAGGGMDLEMRYATELFEAETAGSLLAGFRSVALYVLEHPHGPLSDVTVIEADQKAEMLLLLASAVDNG